METMKLRTAVCSLPYSYLLEAHRLSTVTLSYSIHPSRFPTFQHNADKRYELEASNHRIMIGNPDCKANNSLPIFDSQIWYLLEMFAIVSDQCRVLIQRVRSDKHIQITNWLTGFFQIGTYFSILQ